MKIPPNFWPYLTAHKSCSIRTLARAEGLLAQDLELATDPELMQIRKMVYSVLSEVHRMKAFVRLKPLGSHILFGYLKPKHHIGFLICNHFARRNEGDMVVLGNAGQSWISLCLKGSITNLPGGSLSETLDELKRQIDICDNGADIEKTWAVYYRSQYCPERRNLQAFSRRMPEMSLKSAGLTLERNKNILTLDEFFK